MAATLTTFLVPPPSCAHGALADPILGAARAAGLKWCRSCDEYVRCHMRTTVIGPGTKWKHESYVVAPVPNIV